MHLVFRKETGNYERGGVMAALKEEHTGAAPRAMEQAVIDHLLNS